MLQITQRSFKKNRLYISTVINPDRLITETFKELHETKVFRVNFFSV